ncbi:glycosyltransferase family 2 protein [Cellulomonas sp. McL0617]|uniref:glycosyltransferase family 2 protein n=1 Tax=Cellulomonas sp. McL0617 TaxID=3415675 RepID=UPI003CF597AF
MLSHGTVRAVVVSWNGAHLLPACLDSLAAQTLPVEVVVVDNASTDGTADLLVARDVRVVRAGRNLGFAGGAALGMRGATGHVVLLNNDATFAPDAVERLVHAFDEPSVGAATAKILLAGTDPVLVNSTGNIVTADGRGTDRDFRRLLGTESADPDVFGFCGGAALLRREMLDAVGGFDPSLFLYYEDTDLSWRMRAAGWSVRYVPAAVAEHQHAASSGTDSPVFRYYNTRNSLVVLTRHAPKSVAARSLARQGLGLLRAALSAPTAPTTRARARGIGAHVLRLPRTLAERRRVWDGSAVSRADVATYVGRA